MFQFNKIIIKTLVNRVLLSMSFELEREKQEQNYLLIDGND